MYRNYFFFLVALISFFPFDSSARPTKKKVKAWFRLLEATSQRTLPGIPGAPVKTDYHFLVVWQDSKKPEQVFWNGDDGWQSCAVRRVHKVVRKDATGKSVIDYRGEKDIETTINKGDTLDFRPITGRRAAKPAGFTGDPKNTLIFKVGENSWNQFSVTKITRMPDIALP
jgi:hypothetical protein